MIAIDHGTIYEGIIEARGRMGRVDTWYCSLLLYAVDMPWGCFLVLVYGAGVWIVIYVCWMMGAEIALYVYVCRS